MIRFLFLIVGTFVTLFAASTASFADNGQAPSKPLLKAALFVQNIAGNEFSSQIEPLSNHLAARLSEKGFSIIDRRDILSKFKESSDTDPTAIKALKAVEQLVNYGKSDTRLEDSLTGASALRIARQLGADYLVIASINSISQETRTFNGQGTVYGTSNASNVFTLRVGVKVLESGRGGSIYGDMVTASERVAIVENLKIATNDIYPRLIESAATKVSENIASKVDRIAAVKVDPQLSFVTFTVSSNIEGATVELDGAAIGSTPGKFSAEPGIHTLRVTKEWLTNWERTVNIVSNQVFNVSLELSDEGIRRYTTLEQFKASIGIAKEQSEAEAYAKKKIAEGEKAKREKSYDRYEGAPTTNIIH